MVVGYRSERLHHAIHPLFLNLTGNADWVVGQKDEAMEWYIKEEMQGFSVQNQKQYWQFEEMVQLKRFFFDYFAEHYQVVLPWGILSGIRPSKLSRSVWNHRKRDDFAEFEKSLWNSHRVSQGKAMLLWEVLNLENEYLDKIKDKQGIHLYIGIPYCPSRCYYCSFAAGVLQENDKRLQEYVELLEMELEHLRPVWQSQTVRTIYFGGGTPTILSAELLERLFCKVAQVIPLNELEEFTVEAGRPDTITYDKLKVLKKYGVNRISINPQTFSEKTLHLIGRNHSVEQVQNAYAMAKEMGFLINMDLIFGLKGENQGDIAHSYEQIIRLMPDNITVHTLAPKRGADLSGDDRTQIGLVSRSIGDMLDFWREKMHNKYQAYYLYRQKNIYFENIGYTLKGRECIYNMETMLERESIVAIGAGSISKRVEKNRICRWDMPKEITAYRKAVKERLDEKRAFFMALPATKDN